MESMLTLNALKKKVLRKVILSSIKLNTNVFIVLLLLIFSFSPILGQSKKELSLKIAYVSKIVGLIRWNSELTDKSKWVYGVLDDDKSFDLMRTAYKLKKIKNKTVSIVEVTDQEIDSEIDVLFVGKYYEGSLPDLLKLAEKYSILVITSNDGFGVKGSHINFFFENKKLRFEINLVSLRKAELDVNSFLLNYAKIVGEPE